MVLACNAIKKAQAKFDQEKAILESNPVNYWGINVLEEKGNWWGIQETRPFMRARYAVIEALLKIKTYAAVEAALDHLMDLLAICQGDNMGVRCLVPAIKLRLGKDQNCYDHIKWYMTTGEDSDYAWDDMDLPILNLKDEDPFEKLPENTGNKFANINVTAALLLLKVKMKLDLRSLQQARATAGPKVPQEILDAIVREMRISDTISRHSSLMEAQDLSPQIKTLDGQISELVDGTFAQNANFWKLMLNPGDHLTARPPYTSHGSLEEAQLALQYSYDSWVETPGAMELIKEHLGKRAKKSGDRA